ncbi:MAG: SRPBCC family protein [Actinobacteria bacterium]|nr:SRPBCC family protein [Actinomycetota bacterium]
MRSICNSVFIEKPIEEVYDFLTTAANWPKWHPVTLAVYGAVLHPGLVDEIIIEKVKPGVRIKWKVTRRERPNLWEITGINEFGMNGTIVYTLTEKDGGTLWKRELSSILPVDLPIINTLFEKALLRQSEVAVRQVKMVMESY